METSKMGKIYQEIAVKVNSMIPEEWTKVYLFGEIMSDSRTVYFFYNRASDGKLIYSHDIPSVCNVDEDLYFQFLHELTLKINELHIEYKENNEKEWINMTFILERSGKFEAKLCYDSLHQSEYNLYEQKMIWMYEVLGVEPEDERLKNKLNCYKEKNVKMFWK